MGGATVPYGLRAGVPPAPDDQRSSLFPGRPVLKRSQVIAQRLKTI